MRETEVIIVNGIPHSDYLAIAKNAVEYAILSIPFTFNRMGISNLPKKIINIAKGKLAEGLFFHFCESNSIPIDTSRSQTPFFLPDKNDFILQNAEWDIKNNFLYHKGVFLIKKYYKWLPGLIPNRFPSDQWSKRDQTNILTKGDKKVLFTYLKGGDSYLQREALFDLHLSQKQEKLLRELYHQYQETTAQEKAPYEASHFWNRFFDGANRATLFKLNHYPALIITGYAGRDQWHHFKDSGQKITWNDGLMKTVINNSYSRIHKLPSFASLFPELNKGMKHGQFCHPKGRKNPYL